MGVVLQREEVLESIFEPFHDPRALRFELSQPFDRALVPVDTRVRMQVVVRDDADAGAAGAERDEPGPITFAHEVIRALPPLARGHPRLPGWIVRPVVDLDARLDAEPRGVGAVCDRPGQAELTADQAAPAARVHEPARLHRSGAAGAGIFDHVRAALDLDPFHRAVVDDLDAEVAQRRQQPILEAAAIQLKRRHDGKERRPELGAPADVIVRSLREEVPQPELLEVLRAQDRFEPEHAPEIVRANLDARFADLESGLAHRMESFLQHQHAHVWRFEMKLTRESQSGEPAARNHRIVGRAHRA